MSWNICWPRPGSNWRHMGDLIIDERSTLFRGKFFRVRCGHCLVPFTGETRSANDALLMLEAMESRREQMMKAKQG